LKQIKGLDTLRAFAVLFVIHTHWFPVFFVDRPRLRFIKEVFIPDGATGVYIFFTLSGFLITSILLNARNNSNDKNRLRTAGNFFARRTLRIFPIYYIFLGLMLLVNYYPDIKTNIGWYLTYTSNVLCYRTNSWHGASHTWTLAVEEQFYVCWPWLMLFLDRKYLKYVFATSILIGIASTWYVMEIAHSREPFWMINCIDAFGIGGYYAYIRNNTTAIKRFEQTIKYAGPALLIPYFYWKLGAVENFPEYGVFLKKTIESLIALWLIILIINNKSESVRKHLLENRALNFIGKISYCIYLVHPYIPLFNEEIKRFFTSIFHGPVLIRIVSGNIFIYSIDTAILISVCWLSYVFIEKPFLNLKRLFRYTAVKRQTVISE
jgi:peptidoglycan/LPS O-acetylase OafA/YrhL